MATLYGNSFIRVRTEVFFPEDSPLFNESLERIKDSIAYQMGLKEGLSKRRKAKARASLKEAIGGPEDAAK